MTDTDASLKASARSLLEGAFRALDLTLGTLPRTPEGDDELTRHIAEAIRTHRTRRGKTQGELADALAWPRSKVADLETGRTRLTFIDALYVAMALDIHPFALIGQSPVINRLRAQQARRVTAAFFEGAVGETGFIPTDVAARLLEGGDAAIEHNDSEYTI